MLRRATLLVWVLPALFTGCESTSLPLLKNHVGTHFSSDAVDERLATWSDSLDLPGLSFAYLQDGRIVYHYLSGVMESGKEDPVTRQTIFEAASLSKPVFAYWVLQMAERGMLDLDRPLHYYLPDAEMEREPRYREVTARMVLSHTTGFPNWRWFDPLPAEEPVQRGQFFMIDTPGVFNYSGEGYQYLARVVAHNRFLNMNELGEQFRKEVAGPLGMDHAYFVWDETIYGNKASGHMNGKPAGDVWPVAFPYARSTVFGAAGSLHTEALGYAHFLKAILGKKGLNGTSYDMLTKQQVELPEDHRFREDGYAGWSLGFGIQVHQGDTLLVHGGNNGEFQAGMTLSIKDQSGFVFFTNCDRGEELHSLLEAWYLGTF